MMLSLHPVPLLAIVLCAAPAWAELGNIGIHHPFAITTGSDASTGAAYLLLHNHSDEPDRLLSASSPVAERIEIQAGVEKDGIVTTGPVEGGIAIVPRNELDLAPDGPRLWFRGLTEPFGDCDVITLTLVFEREGERTFHLPVDLDRLTSDAAVAAQDHRASADPWSAGLHPHRGSMEP